jgi:hypothetical protein
MALIALFCEAALIMACSVRLTVIGVTVTQTKSAGSKPMTEIASENKPSEIIEQALTVGALLIGDRLNLPVWNAGL